MKIYWCRLMNKQCIPNKSCMVYLDSKGCIYHRLVFDGDIGFVSKDWISENLFDVINSVRSLQTALPSFDEVKLYVEDN